MKNEDYKIANDRFDVRYGRLLKAGFVKHHLTGDVGYVRPFEIHGLVGKCTFVPTFISNSELMWKPFEAFNSDIQAIIGE